MQSLLGFDFLINKHPGLHTLSAKTCQYITGLSNLYGMLQLLLWLCLRLRPPTDSCKEGQLSRYGVKFPLNAWHCLQQLELPFLSAQTCPAWFLGPCWRCSCLLHRMYICLYFLLVTGFHRDARRGIPVSWKTWKIASWRGDEHLQHTPSSVWCREGSGVGPKMACVAANTCCQVWGAWSVPNFVFL